MKKVLLAGSALVAALSLASAAHAADVSVAPTYDWTGFYIGANAGVAWNNSSLDADPYVDGVRYSELENKIEGDQAAFTAGGMLGYNYQINQIVLGAEADINYLGFSDDNKRSFDTDLNQLPLSVNSKSSLDVDWFGTIRGRLGFAVDNLLIYGTGGAAYGHVNANSKVSANFNDGELTDTWKASLDETNWGWTVGAGMEYGIDNWSLGLEYLYVDLGDGDWSDNHRNVDFPDSDTRLKGSGDFAFSVVRATAKLRF